MGLGVYARRTVGPGDVEGGGVRRFLGFAMVTSTDRGGEQWSKRAYGWGERDKR